MEENFLVIFVEYLAMIICLQRVSKSRIVCVARNVIALSLNFICVLFCMHYYDIGTKICGYISVIVFAKYSFGFTWKDAIKYFGLTAVMMTGLQLLFFVLIGSRLLDTIGLREVGLIENCVIIFVLLAWKRKYADVIVKAFLQLKEGIYIVIFCLFFIYSFYVRNKVNLLNSQIVMQTFLGLVGIILVTMLWLVTEREKKRKTEELHAYELYTRSYEETIEAIKMKQHEFKNHINAIMSMNYTIKEIGELKKRQMEYCASILNDNYLNDLLKVEASPIIIGYLYSKCAFAVREGISVRYNVQDIAPDERIAVHDLVEIIGIFFDNAIEALMENDEKTKKAYVAVGLDKEGKFCIEVANTSREYSINEMSAFFQYGVSTKGGNRGIGLHRARKLSEKYKGTIAAENVVRDGENYISFKVVFK